MSQLSNLDYEEAEEQEPMWLLHKAWDYSNPHQRDAYPDDLKSYLQFICDALGAGFVMYPGKQREDLCELITPSGDPRHAHLSIRTGDYAKIYVDFLKANKSGSTTPPFNWARICDEVH